MSRRTSSCGRDRGQHRQAAAGADHRGGRCGCGAVLPGPGPGAAGPARPGPEQEGACRRWRSRRTARAWRCAPRRAAAAPRPPAQRVRTFDKRARDRGEEATSGWPRPACVFDVIPPEQPRTPGQVMSPEPGAPEHAPRAVNRWYACDITASRDVTIGKIFDEAERRDPDHRADLDRPGRRRRPPARPDPAPRPPPAASPWPSWSTSSTCWNTCGRPPGASTPPRDPAMEDWVTAQGADILHGRVAGGHRPDPAARRRPPAPARRRARQDHPQDPALPRQPSSPTWTTPAPWPAAGPSPPASSRAPAATSSRTAWASPAPAGACRAQAMLWLRALPASGDERPVTGGRTSPRHFAGRTPGVHPGVIRLPLRIGSVA